MAYFVGFDSADGSFLVAAATTTEVRGALGQRFQLVDIGAAPLPGQVWDRATRTFTAPDEEIDRVINEMTQRGLFPLDAAGLRSAWPLIVGRIESGR